MESVIKEFKNVKDMPNWGKTRALPQPNRTVLKVSTRTPEPQYCLELFISDFLHYNKARTPSFGEGKAQLVGKNDDSAANTS